MLPDDAKAYGAVWAFRATAPLPEGRAGAPRAGWALWVRAKVPAAREAARVRRVARVIAAELARAVDPGWPER